VCAEEGFGKASLMQEAHREVQRQNLSVMLVLDQSAAYQDINRLIRSAFASAIWELLNRQPIRIAHLCSLPNKGFLMPRIKRVMREWMETQNKNIDDELEWLGSYHHDLAGFIQEWVDTKRQETPSNTLPTLGIDLNACLRGLFPEDDQPSVYLWLYVQDDFDLQTQARGLCDLLNTNARGAYKIWIKLFVTPAVLRRLDGNGTHSSIDPVVERFNLYWGRAVLDAIADRVCQSQAGVTFHQLVDRERFDAFLRNYPATVPPAPGAWITLAQQLCALSRQHDCRVLPDELWHHALVHCCRTHRKLRFEEDAVVAFGKRLDVDPVCVEVLQAIFAWQNDPGRSTRDRYPTARQIAGEVNRRRQMSGKDVMTNDNAIFAALTRLRTNPCFEPVYHIYYRTNPALAKKHLLHLKNAKGYALENVHL
jgi:hypothetical protein